MPTSRAPSKLAASIAKGDAKGAAPQRAGAAGTAATLLSAWVAMMGVALVHAEVECVSMMATAALLEVLSL